MPSCYNDLIKGVVNVFLTFSIVNVNVEAFIFEADVLNKVLVVD